MGIPILPEPGPFGTDEIACWPVGETPAILWAVFSGIEKGALWNPAIHPSPPNGTFRLEQWVTIEISWLFKNDLWWCQYWPRLGNQDVSQIVFSNRKVPPWYFVFFSQLIPQGCIYSFINDQTEPPPQIFKNGICQIFSSA